MATNENEYRVLLGKLAAYAAANKQKDKLIEHSLQFLKACEVGGATVVLILAKPVIEEDFIDWTVVGSRENHDVREALVTRRILAGYLPLCCLIEDKTAKVGWRAHVDETLVPDEYRDEFLVFASDEATIIANTLSPCPPGNQKLSLQMMQAWVTKVFHERPLSSEELSELDRRTDAACEKYGWSELGKQYDSLGQHEQTRNIAYLVLHREMPFRQAAFEYLSALERGSRQLAADTDLDAAAASLLSAIAARLDGTAIALGAGQTG